MRSYSRPVGKEFLSIYATGTRYLHCIHDSKGTCHFADRDVRLSVQLQSVKKEEHHTTQTQRKSDQCECPTWRCPMKET